MVTGFQEERQKQTGLLKVRPGHETASLQLTLLIKANSKAVLESREKEMDSTSQWVELRAFRERRRLEGNHLWRLSTTGN